MIALLQRVTSARVQVDGLDIAAIEQGLLVFLGVEKNDTQQLADRLLNKILSYRVFEDQQGKMNLSLTEVRGGLLLVPQFTLAANTERGLRPSFSSAAPPSKVKNGLITWCSGLFHFILELKRANLPLT